MCRATERQNSAQSVGSKRIGGGKARRTVSIAEGNNTAFSPVKDPPDFEMSSAIENEPLSMFSEPSLNSSKVATPPACKHRHCCSGSSVS